MLQSPIFGSLVLVMFMNVVVLGESAEVEKDAVRFASADVVEVKVAFIVRDVAFRDMVEVAFQPVVVLVLFPSVVGGVPSSP